LQSYLVVDDEPTLLEMVGLALEDEGYEVLTACNGIKARELMEQTAFARAHRLTSLLQPGARAKLDLVTRGLLAHLASGSENVDPYALAQQEVRSKFAQLSSEQSNLLSFYVLAEVARILTVPDELKGKLRSMNEMSEMTSLRLQMMMDRRSKFISTLSNIMKKISTTQDTLVQNLK